MENTENLKSEFKTHLLFQRFRIPYVQSYWDSRPHRHRYGDIACRRIKGQGSLGQVKDKCPGEWRKRLHIPFLITKFIVKEAREFSFARECECLILELNWCNFFDIDSSFLLEHLYSFKFSEILHSIICDDLKAIVIANILRNKFHWIRLFFFWVKMAYYFTFWIRFFDSK